MVSGSVPDGGKLYDKWWTTAEVAEPTGDQPLWGTQDTNTREGKDTWRCKECHGWDYMGADGAYGSGSHFTGFTGVFDASGMSDGELLAWLNGSTNADHDFSAMGDDALGSMVTFLQEGLVDMRDSVDYAAKAPVGGDTANGQALFEGTCAACHGADGRTINFHDPEEPEFVGNIAVDNPWEFIHKVRSGQPGTPMPSSIANGWSMQDVVDVLAYSQTLPTVPPPPGSVSRGGRLYDKWWSEAGLDTPTGDNPVWARQDTNTREGADSWRCKECHGWDYMGADGAYGSGSHFTGFPGVYGAMGKSADDVMAQLTGGLDPEHDFSVLDVDSLTDLVSFITSGLVDVSPYIDAATKAAVGGDAAHGAELYASACVACHGEDGRMINFHDPEEPEFVGNIAQDNPWEFIHKVRVGQPGTAMTRGVDVGWSLQDIIDILTHAQTLPTEAP
jgi:thiosulfate dehydrogenase